MSHFASYIVLFYKNHSVQNPSWGGGSLKQPTVFLLRDWKVHFYLVILIKHIWSFIFKLAALLQRIALVHKLVYAFCLISKFSEITK